MIASVVPYKKIRAPFFVTDNCEILCSEANLAIDRADLGNCSNVVLILGLPVAITKRELEIFVDPFADGIEGLCLLKERKCFNTGQASAPVTQYKSMALVFFVDQNRLASFKDLYNNMQLPSYRYETFAFHQSFLYLFL